MCTWRLHSSCLLGQTNNKSILTGGDDVTLSVRTHPKLFWCFVFVFWCSSKQTSTMVSLAAEDLLQLFCLNIQDWTREGHLKWLDDSFVLFKSFKFLPCDLKVVFGEFEECINVLDKTHVVNTDVLKLLLTSRRHLVCLVHQLLLLVQDWSVRWCAYGGPQEGSTKGLWTPLWVQQVTSLTVWTLTQMTSSTVHSLLVCALECDITTLKVWFVSRQRNKVCNDSVRTTLCSRDDDQSQNVMMNIRWPSSPWQQQW